MQWAHRDDVTIVLAQRGFQLDPRRVDVVQSGDSNQVAIQGKLVAVPVSILEFNALLAKP